MLAGAAGAATTRSQLAPEVADDIRLLVRELEARHPNPYHSQPRAEFERREDLIARLPLLVELMRLTVLGDRDGHTGMFPGLHRRDMHRYPLRFYYFADGVHVVRAQGVPDAVGSKLVAVSSLPLADLEALVRPLVPGDNAWSRLNLMPGYLVTAEVLHGLRVLPAVGPRGRATFSAAQNFVTRLDRSTRAIFVGEPTGGSPNHYSGGGQLELPFLGLHVGMSIGYIQDSRPDDPRLALEPEVRVNLTSADFMAGRDPALEAALRLRR